MKPSGLDWVQRFPGSVSLDDLMPDFRERTRAFVRALKDAGAKVRIAATYRPPERAWLMHWSWLIAKSKIDPAMVPQMKGVDIAWQHMAGTVPDLAASRAAAAGMKNAYDIQYPPALVSRHTQRRAVDMTVGWKGALHICDASGKPQIITSGPRNGLNHALIEIGRGFGVMKLFKDPPHWSDDGH